MSKRGRVDLAPLDHGLTGLAPSGALLLALLILTGCVKRAIIVESDPPGAQVWINEHPVGITPVTYEFITHGRYKFRLEKKGFREITVREVVKAPIYQWIPIDFIAEYLLPFHWEDRHRFTYRLTPLPPEERLGAEKPADLTQTLADLNHPDPEKRRVACIVLAERRDPTTKEAALKASRDPNPKVRAAALGAWRAIQGPQGMERLLEALRQDPDRAVRWQAASELEAMGSQEAVPKLIEALKDRDPLVRAGAAEALKGIPDPRSVQPLIRALKDRDTAVRRAATEGLGKIGDRAAVGALSKVLFHHDFQTRRKAVEALARLRDPASGPALVRTFTDWDPKIRLAATQALIEFGDQRVVTALIRRLRAFKTWTRAHAAEVLGGMREPKAIGPLRQALLREPDENTRQIMRKALSAIEGPKE